MANHKHETKNKLARWALLVLACICLLAVCSRMSTTGVERDPFRGVDKVFE